MAPKNIPKFRFEIVPPQCHSHTFDESVPELPLAHHHHTTNMTPSNPHPHQQQLPLSPHPHFHPKTKIPLNDPIIKSLLFNIMNPLRASGMLSAANCDISSLEASSPNGKQNTPEKAAKDSVRQGDDYEEVPREGRQRGDSDDGEVPNSSSTPHTPSKKDSETTPTKSPQQQYPLRFTSKGYFSSANLIKYIETFLLSSNPKQTPMRLKRDAIRIALDLIEMYGSLEMVQKGQLFQESSTTMLRYCDRTVRIVVVGGGFAGRKLLRNLEAKLNKFPYPVELILVESKHCFESLPSIPSLLRDYSNLTKIRASFDRYFRKTRVVLHGLKKILSDDAILLDNDEIISDIDYLVLATGSKYNMQMIPTREGSSVVNCADASDVVRNYKKIHEAQSIAVIGGGPVGLEIAGEIAVKYPNKKVHLISSREILLERCCKAAHKNTLKFFQSYNNVNVILGKHVKEITPTHVVTSDGEEYEADITMACIGFSPQTAFLRDGKWDDRIFDRIGQIKVNEYFQIDHHPTVFAIGDICDIVEEKLAQVAEKHANLLAKNLLQIETGSNMKAYKPKVRPIFISLGPKHSIFIHGELVIFEGFMMALVKHLIEYKMMR